MNSASRDGGLVEREKKKIWPISKKTSILMGDSGPSDLDDLPPVFKSEV